MKVKILSRLIDGPWGGGNQFQKSLFKFFKDENISTIHSFNANVIFINGHQWTSKLLLLFLLKKIRNNILFVHRVDGPMFLARGSKDQFLLDKLIIFFNKKFIDGTIFQSEWTKRECLKIGFGNFINEPKVIHNAADREIFYRKKIAKKNQDKKINLVSSSWSTNQRKGFYILDYLDQNLDFKKYNLTFIGNTSSSFMNIKILPPLDSVSLAREFRKGDIYIQTSEVESCSNSVIEAISCGLIPLARDNSSHPELISLYGGILYKDTRDIIQKLDLASSEIYDYKENLNPPKIETIGKDYYSFFETCFQNNERKKVSTLSFLNLVLMIILARVKKIL